MKQLLAVFLSFLLLLLFYSVKAQNLKISELLFHVSDVDDEGHEYIEIVGTPNATISSGTYFIAMSGTQNLSPGFVLSRIDLSGMALGSNGYLVLLQEGNTYSVDPLANVVTGVGTGWGNLTLGAHGGLNLRDGSFSYFLINTSITPFSSIDYGSGTSQFPNGVLNSNASAWTILDGIGHLDGSSGDAGYADINFSTNGNGSTANLNVSRGGFLAGYYARNGSTTGSTAADWVIAEVKGVGGSSFTLDAGGNTLPNSYKGNQLDDIGSLNTFSVLTSLVPTLTSFGEEIAAMYADKELELTLSDMIAAGDEFDADGSVTTFVVQSVASGTLRIGANVTVATPFVASTNDRIDPSNFAYWTPDAGAEGNGIVAFDVKAEDNDGLLSANAVDVKLDVVGNIQISEVLFHLPDVPDITNEYVEIKGTPNATIPPNTFFLCVSGEDPGKAFLNFDLAGLSFGSNGYLLLVQDQNSYTLNSSASVQISSSGRWLLGGSSVLFENDSYSYLLVLTNQAITLGTDYDTNNDGELDGISNLTILDGVANLDGGTSDVAYGPLAFSADGSGISQGTIQNTGGFIPSYFARRKGTSGNTSKDWMAAIVEGVSAVTFKLKSGSTFPLVSSGTSLDHIGGDNLELHTWQGVSSDWSNATNWSMGSVPTNNSLVLIPNTPTLPQITSDVSAETLEIESGAIVTIHSGAGLSVLDTIYGAGQARVLRNKSGNGNYSIIGSPIQAATISDLSANHVYDYDGSSFTVPGGAMPAGKGYFVSYNAASPTIDLTGVPNSGALTLPVTTAGDGFNLVANPYTAAIERIDFIFENTLLDGNIWIWDDGGTNSGTDRGGDYILVNNLGTVSTVALRDGIAGEKGASAFSGHLGTMQGFLVKPNSNGDITFKPNMLSQASGSNDDASFFRKESQENRQIIKLALSGADNYNEMIVGFLEGATLGKDHALDGERYSVNENMSFYSFLNEKPYSIQALPLVTEPLQIQLGMDIGWQGSYKLSVISMENLSEIKAQIRDVETGIIYPLDEATTIDFAINAMEKSQRFILEVQPSRALNVQELGASLLIAGNEQGVELTYERANAIEHVALYDLSGKMCFQQEVSFQNGQASIPVRLLKGQMYVLKAGSETVKFIIK